MFVVLKLILVAGLVAVLYSSERFRSMSQDLDQTAIAALKRFMQAAEDSGFPPEMIPILMLLTVWTFMAASGATTVAGR